VAFAIMQGSATRRPAAAVGGTATTNMGDLLRILFSPFFSLRRSSNCTALGAYFCDNRQAFLWYNYTIQKGLKIFWGGIYAL
jgi:hypothetical protein